MGFPLARRTTRNQRLNDGRSTARPDASTNQELLLKRTFFAAALAGVALISFEASAQITPKPVQFGVALGADLNLRYFPGSGPRLHDRFQAPMTETLLRALDPRWQVDLEVPILRPARGLIDLVLADMSGSATVAGEVYSELRRLEQQIRWSAEKADGLGARLEEDDRAGPRRSVSRLLVLRSTVTTREIARRYEATLEAAYPARTRDVFLALTTPTAPWPGSGIVWMHHHGTETSLMPFPPPHISLGR